MEKHSKSLLLGQRKGLPDDLKYLLKKYPRGDWRAHDNLGSMAKFWLKRHNMFRELGGTLNKSIGDYRENKVQAPQFASFFVPRLQFFLQNLHGHHQIEDEHYFPVFVKAERGLKRGFELLDNDHHIIHDTLDANAKSANSMLKKLSKGRDASRYAADAYADHTSKMIKLLLRHLEDEEDLIIPVILDRGEDKLGVSI